MAEESDRDQHPDAAATGRRASDLLTVEELATWLRLKPKGIYAMVEARRIPAIKISNRLRFSVGEIQNWLRGNRVPAFSEKTP